MGTMPEEVARLIKRSAEIRVKYKNWRGEVAVRRIIPLSVLYGNTEYHKEEQWLMKVWDLDKEDYRIYAVKDILEWMF